MIKILQMSLLVASVISTDNFNKDNASKYEGSQLIKVKKDKFSWNFMMEKGLDVWSGNETFYDVLVRKKDLNEVKQFFYRHSILYTVADDNIATTIRKDYIQKLRKLNTKKSIIPTFQRYQTLEEMHGYLDYLAKKYPRIARVGVMGKTIMGRPLKFITISSGKNNAKAFFIDGGIHAREWIAPASATFIIKQLVENRKNLSTPLLNLDFFILPLYNPDGYKYSFIKDRLWRKNRSKHGKCYGVDLNRNFDIAFGGKGTSHKRCSQIYHGPRPNSELETRAVTTFLLNHHKNLVGYVSLHSYGQYILLPYGYRKGVFPKNYHKLKNVGDKAATAIKIVDSQHYKVGNAAGMLYPATGVASDWVKKYIGAKYSYSIELRDNGQHGFLLPGKFILPTSVEIFEAIKVIAKAAYEDK